MKKLIVGNWKLYPTLSDSLVLASHLKKSLEEIRGVDVAVAPPLPWLLPIAGSWKHKLPHLHLAAQNLWPEDQGAYTGEISAYMLKDVVRYALIGHSERRQYGHEDNVLIGQKVHSALKWGITPILCVGEAKKVLDDNGHSDDQQWSSLKEQLLTGLEEVTKEKLPEMVVAYEPVWAIGSHNPARPDYANEMVSKLRAVVNDQHGSSAAAQVRFIYGGSVTAANAGDYLRQSEINGLLPGSVSVKAKDFVTICQLAAGLA